jgi:hypothetical protein
LFFIEKNIVYLQYNDPKIFFSIWSSLHFPQRFAATLLLHLATLNEAAKKLSEFLVVIEDNNNNNRRLLQLVRCYASSSSLLRFAKKKKKKRSSKEEMQRKSSEENAKKTKLKKMKFFNISNSKINFIYFFFSFLWLFSSSLNFVYSSRCEAKQRRGTTKLFFKSIQKKQSIFNKPTK